MILSFFSSILQDVIVEALAFIIPINTNSSHITNVYKGKAQEMLQVIITELPTVETHFITHGMPIVQQMLSNTWDEAMFIQLLQANLDYAAEEYYITCEVFDQSLQFIQDKHYGRHQLIVYLCENKPYDVIRTLNYFKLSIQSSKFIEQRLVHLFRICVLIEKIIPFLVNSIADVTIIREFFIQDLIFFFNNTIMNDEYPMEVKTAACCYYARFLQNILPKCIDELKPFLNHIVSALVPLIKVNQSTKIAALALEILQFLIIAQGDRLKDAIGLLDNFPATSVFDNLRSVHENAKYNGRTFTLVEEIEYFLKVEKRKIEGLIALKEQVFVACAKLKC